MPRYFFHLHAGESRANPDTTGQRLPDPDAAWEAAWRIARQLLAWNLEPVPWLDYQFQVTDEAGEIRAGGRTITLAGIEGLAQNATCRARDGTRWSCAKLAREALRARVGNQSLTCSTEQEASATVLVATCTTRAGDDLAHALVADGWARATDDVRQRYGSEMAAAEQQGLGLWGWQMEGRMKRR